MNRKERVSDLIHKISDEVLEYIKENESPSGDRWVSSIQIKDALALNFVAVPKANKQYGEKGWLFAIIARILEDSNKVEYKKIGNRAYYRSVQK